MIGVIGITSCSGKQKKEDFTTKIETNSQEKNVVTKIEVRKVDFGILTIIDVECIKYEHFFNSEIQTCIIENKDSIRLFMDIICHLREDNFVYNFHKYPDVRAKLLIYHQNNDVDTLCMDKFCITVNDKLYIFDEKLLEIVENL
jgi:hypothetical protein